MSDRDILNLIYTIIESDSCDGSISDNAHRALCRLFANNRDFSGYRLLASKSGESVKLEWPRAEGNVVVVSPFVSDGVYLYDHDLFQNEGEVQYSLKPCLDLDDQIVRKTKVFLTRGKDHAPSGWNENIAPFFEKLASDGNSELYDICVYPYLFEELSKEGLTLKQKRAIQQCIVSFQWLIRCYLGSPTAYTSYNATAKRMTSSGRQLFVDLRNSRGNFYNILQSLQCLFF